MLKNKEEIKKGEFDLKEAFVLWKDTAKSGNHYLKGNTAIDEKENSISLVGYFNTNKKNPKEPDVRIYCINDEGKQDKEVCNLWETVSKGKEKRYLTGMTDDKERIIGFYTEEQNKEGTRPYIRAYYKN